MDEILQNRLRVDISVQIAVLPTTLWRSFAGLGVRRRRDFAVIDILLETFAGRLMAPFIFRDVAGIEPTEAELHAAIKATFIAVDETLITTTVKGEMQSDRDKARSAIADIVAEAIEVRWTYVERPRRASHSIRTLTTG